MSENALVPYHEIEKMAAMVVASRLFPSIGTTQAAMTLMLLCQAEGLHPVQALRRYDIIQGRPALKTDAMLADFQKMGGKVKWLQLNEEVAEAEFHSPGLVEPVTIKFDTEDATRAGLIGKENWKKYPRAMRRARVISEGIRTAMPGVNSGVYTPEETQDMEPARKWADATIVAPEPPQDVTGALESSIAEVQEAKAFVKEAAKKRAQAVAHYAPRGFDKKNAAALDGPPPVCTLPGCSGKVQEFESTSKQYQGRRYYQCSVAYLGRQAALEQGIPNGVAVAQFSKHYREWAEPWPRKEEASAAVEPSVSRPEPEAAAPLPF